MTGTPSAEPPSGSRLAPDTSRVADRRERVAGAGHAFQAVKAQHAARRTSLQVLADGLTQLASSPRFLVLHLLWFVTWVVTNSGVVDVRPFDPYPFGLLTLLLSMEAIVLTIFVLMSQRREAAVAELREEITLQVNLRVEEEVTKTLQLVTGLYGRLGFEIGDEPELRDMLRPLDAHRIEHELVAQMGAAAKSARAARDEEAQSDDAPDDDAQDVDSGRERDVDPPASDARAARE